MMKKFLRTVTTYVREFFTFDESTQGRKKRKEVCILAGLFCTLVISALIVGVSDNMPGIVLCYLATIVLVVAATRTWRKTKRFLILMVASVIGFFVFVILHNAFYALAMLTEHIIVLSNLMEVLHAVFFIIAVFLCPAIFLVGAAGSILCDIRERRRRAIG